MKASKLLKNPYFLAAVAGAITIPLLRPCLRNVPDPPPVLAELPAYALTSQDGEAFGSEQLRGHVYVANFIFTTCRSMCPGLTRAMASLQDKFEQIDVDIRLVSFTVDPATDTPERLEAYAEEYGADTSRWTFLTGSEEELEDLIVNGFMTAVGEPQRDGAGMIDIAHSAKFILIDRDGQIRGYYDSDELGLDEIFHRSQHVFYED